jgi:hypothetical protein
VYAPFHTLIGDPTFNPQWQPSSSQDLLHSSVGSLVPQATGFVATAEIAVDAVATRRLQDIRTQQDWLHQVVSSPYYAGDVTFRAYAAYSEWVYDPPDGSPTHPGPSTSVAVVISIPNPGGKAYQGIRYATRQIGSTSPVDITSALTSAGAAVHAETNRQGVTFVHLPLDMGQSIIGLDVTSLPAVQFHVELLFQ